MLGLCWLNNVVQPSIITPNGKRHILIVDGHSSHVTPGFIAFCINHTIDLMVLPAHSSHVTQPFNIAVFRPLKIAMAKETDRMRGQTRLQKADWASLLVHACQVSMTATNIKSGWT